MKAVGWVNKILTNVGYYSQHYIYMVNVECPVCKGVFELQSKTNEFNFDEEWHCSERCSKLRCWE